MFEFEHLPPHPMGLKDSSKLRRILAVSTPKCWPLAADARAATVPAMANATELEGPNV